ncbi:MAG: hypothetical protein IKM31_04870 [Oscillospiraceae bacterium]|nr:hypothetical protein [Oscillospiraceae bacterium]
MLYKKNSAPVLEKSLFENPTAEYRGTPFWAWNCKLDKETLAEQIDIFRKMGQGGFHMHVRTGLDTPYLTDEYMDFIRFCVEKAKKDDMLAWLYDEDRWPSGAAGGIVTKDKRFAAKNILFTRLPYGSDGFSGARRDGEVNGGRTLDGELKAVYDIVLNTDGTLKSYRLIGEDEEAEGDKWYAYAETISPNAWFNGERYLDTLNPEAVQKFIEVTHERYKAELKEEFGGVIPAIFTDEPQFTTKSALRFADEKADIFAPWTDKLAEKFKAATGLDFFEGFPEVLWELPDGKVSKFRYLYHDFLSELFAEAFCDTVGDWCTENGLMLGGHLMSEPTLESQTNMIGEAMRCYRAFRDMPGIDMLCDHHEYSTAKQCQSAKHQQGGVAMLSELYGVTGWDYDFRGHKLQGDWQAALGVTVRVPHLTWMSMKGEAKRDYPACIGYQSPWADRYGMIEDHFARVATALTRGKPEVKVGVIHPIESYWIHRGPFEQTAAIREQLEKNYQTVLETLLFGLVDFDLICESRLPDLCKEGGAPLRVGEMAYDAVIVPACETLRATTLERLEAFRAAGGKLIFMGDCPRYLDAEPSEAVKPLFEKSERISFSASALLDAVDELRFIDIRGENGARSDRQIYQLRSDGTGKWLFIANGKNPVSPHLDKAPALKFSVEGEWALTEYDTLTGEIKALPASYKNGRTVFTRRWFNHDSLLLRLEPGRCEGEIPVAEKPAEWHFIAPKAKVTLDEPNVMLLDMAEYAPDDEPFRPEEELLRLDNICRVALGIPTRQKHVVQPYLLKKEKAEHQIRLRFTIDSEIECEGAHIALEDAAECVIRLNGESVPSVIDGWYVDKCIETVALPLLKKGENILEVIVPLSMRSNLEWMYLLGDFGVAVNGRVKKLTAPVRELAFGSFTHQGLPFYTGNLTYEFDLPAKDGVIELRAGWYAGALLEVYCDGELKGNIVFSPYTIKLEGLADGDHRIGLKFYGTRQNGFGPIHHDLYVDYYQDPNSWRSKGEQWSYEYQLKEFGILRTPEVR